MKNTQKILAISIVAIICFYWMGICAQASETDVFSTSPRTNQGQKWRIAYYQGGPSETYYNYLATTIRGLIDLGWIQNSKIPIQENNDTEFLWTWLTQEIDSEYIEFVGDAYYTAKWDKQVREALKTRIINRLTESKDIDLIIAMGTWAGKDLANNEHSVPTVVMSTSDPIKSGIVKSIEKSGYGHIFARIDPQRYERQVRIFHDIIGFRKLGVAYENSVFGRSYSAIDLVEEVAKERGFEVVSCFTKSDIADLNVAGQSVLNCFEELSKKVDAIYVTLQGGVNSITIPQLVKISNRHRIATFSQAGSSEVKQGFFLSISRTGGFKPVGLFLAATLAKIFNGAKPGKLNQVFEDGPNIAINLKTAEIIGFYLYADVLAAADEIYREIEE